MESRGQWEEQGSMASCTDLSARASQLMQAFIQSLFIHGVPSVQIALNSNCHHPQRLPLNNCCNTCKGMQWQPTIYCMQFDSLVLLLFCLC